MSEKNEKETEWRRVFVGNKNQGQRGQCLCPWRLGRLQEVLWKLESVQHKGADAVGVQQVPLRAVPKAGTHGTERKVHGAAVSSRVLRLLKVAGT